MLNENPLTEFITADLNNENLFKRRCIATARKTFDISDIDAEDNYQKLYLRASTNQTYDPKKENPRVYLERIYRNLCIDFLRKSRRQRDHEILESTLKRISEEHLTKYELAEAIEEPPLANILREESIKERLGILTLLTEEERKILEKTYLIGKKYKEIAESRRIPIGTVKSKLFSIKEKLRKITQEQNQDEI